MRGECGGRALKTSLSIAVIAVHHGMNKIRNIHTIVVGSWRVQSPSKARVKDWDKKEGKDCYAEEMGMFVTSHNIEYLNFTCCSHCLESQPC